MRKNLVYNHWQEKQSIRQLIPQIKDRLISAQKVFGFQAGAVVSKYLKQGSLMKRIWEFVKNGEIIWSYGKTGRIEQKTRGLRIWDGWQVWKSIKICYWSFYMVSSFTEISSLTKSLIPPPLTSWSSLNTVFNLSTLYYSSGNWKSPSFLLDRKHYLYFN